MNALKQIQFSISSGNGYSLKNNDSELINMFVHIEEAGSKSNHILINTEGTKLIDSVDYIIYGVYEFKDTVYIATEKILYVFDNITNTFKIIGAVNFNREVVFSDNGIDIMIVGGNGYSYTPKTDTLKNMNTELGWYPADTVSYMDGYFIFNRNGTGQFFISKLYSTVIDPIDWASAESAPDDTVAVKVNNRQLWLFGKRSIEVWYDSGNIDFPFTRISGAVTEIGLVNHQTLGKARDNLFFVGNDFKVYMTSGYSPKVVSTPSVEKKLSKCNPSLLSGFCFTSNGHWFYILHIDNKYTFVYDKDTAQWHKRVSNGIEQWSISKTVNINRTNELIGYFEKNFYNLSIDNLTDDSIPIRREMISLPINKGVNRFILSELQLDMETGFKNNAQVILQLSDDGGVTWSNNHYASTGNAGKEKQRVRWLRLGQHRDCIVRIVIVDAIPIRILGLYARFA